MSPGELPWPMPMPLAWAKGLLVVAFLGHLLAVNLTLGGQLLAVALRAWALRAPASGAWDLAQRLSQRVVVAKSALVALGVGPLMLIQVAYPEPFLSATTLLAPVWLALPPWIAVAFLFILADRQAFGGWGLRHPRAHLALGALAAAWLWAVPWVYLSVTNLMIQPQAWPARPGLLEVIAHVGNVPARYGHVLLASLAIAGLWLGLVEARPQAWAPHPAPSPKAAEEGEAQAQEAGTPGGAAAPPLEGPREGALARLALRVGAGTAAGSTAAQFVMGPAVLFTLPPGALAWPAATTLGVGVLAGALALFAMADAFRGERDLRWALPPLLLALLMMGTTRHLIRERLLTEGLKAPPKAAAPVPKRFPLRP